MQKLKLAKNFHLICVFTAFSIASLVPFLTFASSTQYVNNYFAGGNSQACDVCHGFCLALSTAAAFPTGGLSLVGAAVCMADNSSDPCWHAGPCNPSDSTPSPYCVGGDNVPITSAAIATKCCDVYPGGATKAKSPIPSTCPGFVVSKVDVGGAWEAIDEALRIAVAAIRAAISFMSSLRASFTAGDALVSSGAVDSASAGSIVDPHKTKKAEMGAGGSNSGNRSSKGASGGGSGSGTSGDLFGNKSTEPTGTATPTGNDPTQADNSGVSSLYSPGGLSPNTAGAGSEKKSLFGSGSGFGSGSEAQERPSSADLGPQDNLPPILGEDPEDYFTRIGLDESFFKRVHDRYMAVAFRWAEKKPF